MRRARRATLLRCLIRTSFMQLPHGDLTRRDPICWCHFTTIASRARARVGSCFSKVMTSSPFHSISLLMSLPLECLTHLAFSLFSHLLQLHKH